MFSLRPVVLQPSLVFPCWYSDTLILRVDFPAFGLGECRYGMLVSRWKTDRSRKGVPAASYRILQKCHMKAML